MRLSVALEFAAIALALAFLVFVISMLQGCGLTQKEADDIGKVSATILCVIEHEELDDEALNKACDLIQGQLTPEQRKAIAMHRTRVAAKACTP